MRALTCEACVSSAPQRPRRISLPNIMAMLFPSEAAASCVVPKRATKYRFTVANTAPVVVVPISESMVTKRESTVDASQVDHQRCRHEEESRERRADFRSAALWIMNCFD